MDEVRGSNQKPARPSPPPLRYVARKDAAWDPEPADINRGEMWHWWEKVRHEIEFRGVTVKQLAEAAEIPYRSLHRWLYEASVEDMSERGPIGELSVVARLGYTLGWTWWYTCGVAWQWPPTDSTLRLMHAWERLIAKRRLDVMDPVAHAMASCCEMAIKAVEANEKSRAAMQLEVLRLLDPRDP